MMIHSNQKTLYEFGKFSIDKFQVNEYKKNLPASLVMQLNCLGLFVKL